MSIARRTFLKSATKTTISAGIALTSASLIFGQNRPGKIEREVTAPRGMQHTTPGDFPIPLEAREEDLFYFTASTFKPYVGDIFQIPDALGQMITLRLDSVSEYKLRKTTWMANKNTLQTESFSLKFSSAEKLSTFTSIHKMSHPALGKFDIFLTSRELEDGTFTYVAVFSRLQ